MPLCENKVECVQVNHDCYKKKHWLWIVLNWSSFLRSMPVESSTKNLSSCSKASCMTGTEQCETGKVQNTHWLILYSTFSHQSHNRFIQQKKTLINDGMVKQSENTLSLEDFAFNFLTDGRQLKSLWVQREPLQLLVFNHLYQLGRQKLQITALIQESADGCRSPLWNCEAWFSACSTDIKLIKRQWLAQEQSNMLISIDKGASEQFMCINEVKNSAKQSNPALECRGSHT